MNYKVKFRDAFDFSTCVKEAELSDVQVERIKQHIKEGRVVATQKMNGTTAQWIPTMIYEVGSDTDRVETAIARVTSDRIL